MRGPFWGDVWLLKANSSIKKVLGRSKYVLCSLVKFWCQWRWSHSNRKRWLSTRNNQILKWINVSLCWYISIYNVFIFFWLKIEIFLWTLFSYLKKYIHSWHELVNLDSNFIPWICHIFSKINVLNWLETNWLSKYCYHIDVI